MPQIRARQRVVRPDVVPILSQVRIVHPVGMHKLPLFLVAHAPERRSEPRRRRERRRRHGAYLEIAHAARRAPHAKVVT